MKFTKIESADGNTFEPSEDSVMRLRYSRAENGEKKNTLLTFANKGSNTVFFAIARCNLDGNDRFSRKRGRAIAACRLKQAISEFGKLEYSGLGRMVGDSLLYGVTTKDKIKSLLEYFQGIDDFINRCRQRSYGPPKDVLKEAVA